MKASALMHLHDSKDCAWYTAPQRPRKGPTPSFAAMRRLVLRCFLAVIWTAFVPGLASASDPMTAISVIPGTLPLVLTVPHDGGEPLGAVPVRTQGKVVRDTGTRKLAERVAALLEERIGKRPYLVIANFSRKYLDVNRAEPEAMQSPDALPAYRAYHGAIAAGVTEIKAKFPQGGLLIDVHGQAQDPETTFLGTRDGVTVRALLSRAGAAALRGEKSISGVLTAKGYAIKPAVGNSLEREDPRFNGGFTVFHYGSHRPEGIDAIQLEFGKHHRANPQLAADLADALVVFMNQFGLLGGALDAPPKHLAIARSLLANLTPEENRYTLGGEFIAFPEDAPASRYAMRADCSGFLLAIFARAGYSTRSRMNFLTAQSKRRRPAAEDFVFSIEQEEGFVRIEKLEHLRPGDLLAHAMLDQGDQQQTGTTGHVFLINSVPKPIAPWKPFVAGTRQFEVEIIDSSLEVVGPDDSRSKSGLTSGLGKGTIRLYADGNGALVGWARTFANTKRFFSYSTGFPSDTKLRKAALGRPKV